MFWQARIFTIQGHSQFMVSRVERWMYTSSYAEFVIHVVWTDQPIGRSVVWASKIIMRVWILCTFWWINSIKVKYNKLHVHSSNRRKNHPSYVCATTKCTACVTVCCIVGFPYELHALQNYLSRFENYHTLGCDEQQVLSFLDCKLYILPLQIEMGRCINSFSSMLIFDRNIILWSSNFWYNHGV